MRAFTGILTPDPKSFTIKVDTFNVWSNEIVFEMHGNDPEHGPYSIEGRAIKQRGGYYKGNAQYRDLKTKRVFDIEEAGSYPVIYVFECRLQEYGCDIEGLWFERLPKSPSDNGGWLFDGSLEHQHQEQPRQ